ncbi:MAG: hypothetical protein E7552_02300 [Ruminococcaceae bacterium]|nr:hypothetical protein [Oscillospiraceae bacterium]
MGSISNSPFAEEALLRARIEDAVRLCKRRSSPVSIGFLDAHQQAVAKGMLHSSDDVLWAFYGGHAEGERTLLGISPDFMPLEEAWFPLTPMAFHYRSGRTLTHRDVLGSLLSAGVRREMIGDILCADGLAVVFVKDEIIAFLQEQIVKIGGEGVHSEVPYTGELPAMHTFVEHRDTVASPRLDAVLRVCLSASREEAARRIETGTVSVNHMPCTTVSTQVHEGDVLSVRGVGRFRVAQLGPPTRKGRLFVTIEQYV